MSTFFRLTMWLWRAWPVIVLAILFFVHLVLLHYFPQGVKLINKTTSLFSQIVGGLLILYSIDSNIGVLKQRSLLSIFANYFKEFPLIKRAVVMNFQGAGGVVIGGTAKVTVGRNPESVEEKIEYLQEQINELKCDIGHVSKDLNEKINRQSKKLSKENQSVKLELRNLESKMDEVSTGGIKVQLFGVLLMLYGAISGFFS